MANSINLILGCHSHQPIGNFGHVFEEAYHKSYLPFVDVLEKFPDVHVTLHYTGPLLDWLVEHQPAFVERLAALAASGQVEIMGGAYYEPLLCAIPERDSLAQIDRMSAFCEKHFGQRPRGMWLTERVWEPHMPRILAQAGIEYTAVDDTHFLCSGHTHEDLYGYWITEDEGLPVKVFPILADLRYMIPFQEVHKSIDYLRECATEDGSRCAVIHDDGEKFGIWPGTHTHVYENRWLENFFEALSENSDWLHCQTYSEYMAKSGALGRTYLPTASYHEMMAWSLPPEMQRRLDRVEQIASGTEAADDFKIFLRGGFWRNFLAKYPESNNIQKRMLRISRDLDRLDAQDSPAMEEARKLLHQGQCNCAYWHGVFGGLYLNHLRTGLYEKLIAAQTIIDDLCHSNDKWVSTTTEDFDGDGRDEIFLENNKMSLALSPEDGGTLFELDFKDPCFNFLNTLSRRDELYHDALRGGNVDLGQENSGDQSIHDLAKVKEDGLEKLLVYDPYRRSSLRDRFLAMDTTAEDLWACREREFGDFATGSYCAKTAGGRVTLVRQGYLMLGKPLKVRVQKTLRVDPCASSVEILYDIANMSDTAFEALFGVEFGINLLAGDAHDRYYRSDEKDLGRPRLGSRGCEAALSHLALRDEWMGVEFGLRLDEPAQIYRFALDTVSQSEGGQERIYQGSIVIPCWRAALGPGEEMAQSLTVELTKLT
jgi:alpha-amylase